MSSPSKKVVVIAGPSGGGKNSIIEMIVAQYPMCARLVTATTRLPRPGEVEAQDYHFLSEEVFLNALASGEIPEHRFIQKLGTHYGTYLPDIKAKIASGKIIIAHMDIIGARYFKEHFNATTLFVNPDSLEMLESRVRGRNPEMSEEEIQARMDIARIEINEHAPEYDYIVTNTHGKLSETVEQVVAIMKKEGYNLG